GRKTAVRYVNTALVATYWLIGRRIVEYEQKGKVRAEYGEAILKRISEDLIKKFGKGFGFTQMKNIRQFYLSYPQKSYTVPGQLGSTVISQTLSGQSEISNTLSAKFPLSWSHYCLLMRLDDSYQREFYEAECASGNWSVRQLDRQIQSMLHERTALSKRKMTVIKNKTVVEYALGGMNNKVFASKYRLKLPDPKVLKREIEQERQRLVEMKIVEKKGANK
ncbi:MAG: DUF1016 N-terminal domain-containing protein, partial [Nitrospirae bacterium]|nr:DUF1016 N-terminal domain-containing protein [Nitrospirota bacterium]